MLDLNGFCRNLLETALNAMMDEQASELCAAQGWRRNGYRERSLSTCIGDVVLRIPKIREGTYFPDDVVERWSRTDSALASAICEMWASGVSSRNVEKVAQKMGLEKMSRSRVSRMCASLDSEVEAMRSADLSECGWPYLLIDANFQTSREFGAARSVAVVVAVAVGARGRRRVVGLRCMDTESYAGWRDFLSDLRRRGMSGVQLVVSDEHAGLVRAAREVFGGAAHQRCIAHLERNVMGRVRRKGDGAAAVAALKAAFGQTDPALVRAGYRRTCEVLAEYDSRGAELLEDAEEEALAYLWFPKEHARWIRTNNICERLNAEIDRRANSVQVFPSDASLIRLIGSVCCDANDKWACEKNFIDARSMEGLEPREPRSEATPEGTDRFGNAIAAEFESARRAA